jgi:polar amino acid transport system substrate-binding protein
LTQDTLSQRRRALIGLGLFAATPALAHAAQPRLTLATGAREPFTTTTNGPGFAEELLREALRRIGHDLAVLSLPPERALVNANAGIEDGDMFRAPGLEKDYPNLVRVPQPLLENDFVAFTLRADVDVQRWADLARYSVAHITGYKILERQLAGSTNVTTVRDNELLLALLANGRADVILNSRWVGLWFARRAGLSLRELEPPLLRVPMFTYLHRRHQALVSPLAEALAEARRDGTWQRLHQRILAPLDPA